MSAPWTWLQHDEPYAITPFTIGDADDNDIAQVFSSECSTVNVTLEQARANARLMTASPLLLEALQAGRAVRNAQRLYFKTRDRSALVASITAEADFDRLSAAAIAAATGEPA